MFFLDYWEFNWALSIKAILKRSFVSIVFLIRHENGVFKFKSVALVTDKSSAQQF